MLKYFLLEKMDALPRWVFQNCLNLRFVICNMLRQHKKYILIRKQSHKISRELSLVVMTNIVLGAVQFATKSLRFSPITYSFISYYNDIFFSNDNIVTT